MKYDRTEVATHLTMCLAGGFVGNYSLLRCADSFGNAQTANLIHLADALVSGNLPQMMLRLMGALCYVVGIELFVYLKHHSHHDLRRIALVIELICLAIVGLLPAHTSPMLTLYPLFFMMSTQWCVYHGAMGYNSSTIFSTNNLKQFSLAVGECIWGDDSSQKQKAQFFGATLLFFHTGVMVCWLLYQSYGNSVIWLAALPLMITFGWISLGEVRQPVKA